MKVKTLRKVLAPLLALYSLIIFVISLHDSNIIAMLFTIYLLLLAIYTEPKEV